MPRRPIYKKRVLLKDPVYQSIAVNMLVNRVLKDGKKSLAYKIVYTALTEIKNSTGEKPDVVFNIALYNITPQLEMRPRRRAGAIVLVPRLLNDEHRAKATALRWILEGCHKKSGQPMSTKLKNEIMDAYKKAGYALKKRDELYKLAAHNAIYSVNPQIILNIINKQLVK